MSGSIRRLLGPTKGRLQGYIKQANIIFSVPINVSDLDKAETELEDMIQRFSMNIALLERCHKEWTALLSELPKGDEKTAEEKEYIWATDGDDGLIELLLDSHETKARLVGRLEQVLRRQERDKLSPVNVTVPSSRQEVKVTSQIKLPKLDLPIFDGDIIHWQEFWDVFNVAVHEQEVPKVTKFSYLKGSLRGAAATAIGGISITSDNYDTTIQLLKDKFGRKEAIVETLYSRLQHLPMAMNRTGDIKITYENIEKILRQLEAQGEHISHQRILVQQILSKFPTQVIIKLEESKKLEDLWTVPLLRKSLQRYVTIFTNAQRYELNARSNNFGSGSKRPDNFHASRSERSFTGNDTIASETLVTNASNFHPKNKANEVMRPCVFCKGDHFNDCCTLYKSVYDRKKQLQGQGRCFICLRIGHTFKECPSALSKSCYYCKRTGNHHRSICPVRYDQQSKTCSVDGNKTSVSLESTDSSLVTPSVLTETSEVPKPVERESVPSVENTTTSTATTSTLLTGGERVLLQKAQATVYGKDGLRLQARILMDSASHQTFMTKKMAQRLNLQPLKRELLSVSTFGARKAQSLETYVVDFYIVTKQGSTILLHANVLKQITNPIQRGPLSQADIRFLQAVSPEQLADSIPSQSGLSNVDILLGSDYFWNIIDCERIILPSGLLLISSKLGYILTGKYSDPTEERYKGIDVTSCLVMSQDESCLSKIWDLDMIGIYDPVYVGEDDKALEHFNNTVSCHHGRYFVTWPWKYTEVDLPENFDVAFNRMRSLSRRLQRDKSLLQQYCDIIQAQCDAGIIELVDEHQTSDTRKHYLPHHPVVTPLKTTTKVRIVYDASIKGKRGVKSLNECLHRGPITLPNMCGILLRFRCYFVAILADIEKAFLQIGVQEQERDVTRFLWFTDPKKPGKINGNVSVYRFCRVPFGMICSPFLLESTLKFHLKKEGTRIAENIAENIYVDNVCVGTNSAEEAVSLYEEAKSIFERASMNLREWTSNSEAFLNYLSEKERIKGNILKVFGIVWDRKSDHLQIPTFTISCVKETTSICKRQILSDVSKFYDPLGLISPVVFFGKVFLQKLWGSNKLSWDEELPQPLLLEWEELINKWQRLSSLQIPRYVGSHESDDAIYQLLVFCDASVRAYAAAVYLRIVSKESIKVNLVFSKLRLAPLDTNHIHRNAPRRITIPRLELLAVLIGTRALKFVRSELKLPISSIRAFTDSECVLHWIQSTRQLPVFVQNRLNEIRKEEFTFSFVPSDQNPADYATRGLSVCEIIDCDCWWYGPEWLQHKEENWPLWNMPDISPGKLKELLDEPKNVGSQILYESTNTVSSEGHSCTILSPLGIDETKYSSLWRLLRVTVICLKFVKKYVLNKCSQKKFLQNCIILKKIFKNMKEESVYYTEIQDVLLLWVYVVQHRKFHDIFIAIQKGEVNCLQKQLGLEMDDMGILRCSGRLQNANLSEQAKHPKLLPRHEHFTHLLIQYVHERLIHCGVSHTLASLRHEYWILKGRIEVKKVISRCLVCRRHEGPSFSLPKMPPWPKERVSQSSPFQYVGLDYLGPLLVKEGKEVVKVWVCLFTCLTVRAIHLEWVMNLTPDQFLSCLRRFVARRGKPQLIICDNAPQFKVVKTAVDRQWQQLMVDEDVRQYVSESGVRWQFTTALAPWQGGYYERLVGLVKRSLRKSIGQKRFTLEQLVTTLTEIEAIINTRPLTYVYDEFDSGFTLTPAHFLSSYFLPLLMTNRDANEDDSDYYPIMDSATSLLETWKKGQRQLNCFWDIWTNEYLLSLREHSSLYHRSVKNQTSSLPQVGQVVIIKDDKMPRRMWKLGRIEKLVTSKDGRIRTADVYLPGNRHVQRALNMLYPMELYNGNIHNSGEDSGKPQSSKDNETLQDAGHQRDRINVRKAALIAKEKISELMKNNAVTILFSAT